jgi:hypothetical protein
VNVTAPGLGLEEDPGKLTNVGRVLRIGPGVKSVKTVIAQSSSDHDA